MTPTEFDLLRIQLKENSEKLDTMQNSISGMHELLSGEMGLVVFVKELREWKHKMSDVITGHEGLIKNDTKRLDKLLEDHNKQMAKGGCQNEINVNTREQTEPVSNVQALLNFLSKSGVIGIIALLILLIGLLVFKSMGARF